jgi:integrase
LEHTRRTETGIGKQSLRAESFVQIGAASRQRAGNGGGVHRMRRIGHVRERSPGSWELRYPLSADPATGKRRTATATVRGNRKAAEKELRKLLSTLDTGEHVDPNRMVMRDWLNQWLVGVAPEVSPRTHELYDYVVSRFLLPALGNISLTKLGPSQIHNAFSALVVGGRKDGKPGGLAAQTRRHVHRVLSASLARAVEQQLLARNPCDALRRRLPKVERQELNILSVEQSARLLAEIKSRRVYWPVLIALATGARRGEILALRWRNVELDAGLVRIERSLEHTKDGLRFKTPKSGKSRAVVIPAYAVEELRRLRREQSEELLRLGVRFGGDTLLGARADGEPMLPRSLTHEFAKVAGNAEGVPRVRFHDLRHSHATQLLAAGVHPKIAQERLGHASIGITMDLYSHASETMQADAAQRLDLLWKRAKMES